MRDRRPTRRGHPFRTPVRRRDDASPEGDLPRGGPGRAPRVHDRLHRRAWPPGATPDVPGLASRDAHGDDGPPRGRSRRHAGPGGTAGDAYRPRVSPRGHPTPGARVRRMEAGVRASRRPPVGDPGPRGAPRMTARLLYISVQSLDGYVEDAQGKFDWSRPDEEVHRFINELLRPIGTYLYGRRMYE